MVYENSIRGKESLGTAHNKLQSKFFVLLFCSKHDTYVLHYNRFEATPTRVASRSHSEHHTLFSHMQADLDMRL